MFANNVCRVGQIRSSLPLCHERGVLARYQAASFYKVQYEHTKRDVLGSLHVLRFKLHVVSLRFCHVLAKSDDYLTKNIIKSVAFFSETLFII